MTKLIEGVGNVLGKRVVYVNTFGKRKLSEFLKVVCADKELKGLIEIVNTVGYVKVSFVMDDKTDLKAWVELVAEKYGNDKNFSEELTTLHDIAFSVQFK